MNRAGAALAAVAVVVSTAATAGARAAQAADDGVSRMVVDSEAGDHLLKGTSLDGADVEAPSHRLGPDSYEFTSTTAATFADVVFRAANDGERLQVGEYDGAQRADERTGGAPGLYFFTGGLGCAAVTGRFRVDQVSYAADGAIDRFAARFEQHCDNAVAATFGSVAYRATVPVYAHRISMSTVTFPAPSTGARTSTRTVTVVNTGTAPLPVQAAVLTGPDADQFEVAVDHCTGATLAVDASCEISVAYAPSRGGGALAAISIADAATAWAEGPIGSRGAVGENIQLLSGDATVTAGSPDPASPSNPALLVPEPPAEAADPAVSEPAQSSDAPTSAGSVPAGATPAGSVGGPNDGASSVTTATSSGSGAPVPRPLDVTVIAQATSPTYPLSVRTDPPRPTAGSPTPSTANRPGRSGALTLLSAIGLLIGLLVIARTLRYRSLRRRSIAATTATAMAGTSLAEAPGSAASPTPGEGRAPIVAAAPRLTGRHAAEPVVFRIFGGPTFADGRAPGRRANELVARLALDPAGVSATDLAATLGHEQLPATGARQRTVAAVSRARQNVGAIDGRPAVSRVGKDGQYRLDPALTTDLGELLQSADEIRGSTDPDVVLSRTLDAFDALDGAPFALAEYAWVDREGWAQRLDSLVAHLVERALDAARQLEDVGSEESLLDHARRLRRAARPTLATPEQSASDGPVAPGADRVDGPVAFEVPQPPGGRSAHARHRPRRAVRSRTPGAHRS